MLLLRKKAKKDAYKDKINTKRRAKELTKKS